MPDRYALYGIVPREREVNEPMSFEDQTEASEKLIYETDDLEEAKEIYRAGGYTDSGGVFRAVTRLEDRLRAGGGGAGPVSGGALNKDDFR